MITNFEKIGNSKQERAKVGEMIDRILDILEDKRNEVFASTGVKLDNCIKEIFPILFDDGAKPFAENTAHILYETGTTWTRDSTDFCRQTALVTLGKISAVKWDSYAFVKAGGCMGKSAGQLTEYTYNQIAKADQVAASVLGTNVGIVEPGAYTKASFRIDDMKICFLLIQTTLESV